MSDAAEVYGDVSTATTPLLSQDEAAAPFAESEVAHPSDQAFAQVVSSIERAIDAQIHPTRIVQGSSGSYFCYNSERTIVGVFKPKSEEPYGHLNPKWGKWVQKHFCCWCYGRDCLPTNQGYLSEAGASLIDQALQLNIVPKTKVVRLVSTSFHYSRFDRARARAVASASNKFPDLIGKRMSQGLPPKEGSLQLFVRGFKDANVVLEELDMNAIEPATKQSLLYQFQLMVCLDYITRNTDRGNDNWLLKYTKRNGDTPESIQLAAIDNGLSFPRKHPDNWRTYPFHWAWLDIAQEPFQASVAEKLLPSLRDDDFVEDLGDQLYTLFSQDKDFSKSTFDGQLAVMRGQVLNLRSALEERKSPEQLVHIPPLTVYLERRQRRAAVQTRFPFFKRF
eukprot:m.72327 g.72327  ORF g.72327 m.72327 type:complete len:393 (-) comp12330_c0_seq2:70-1248(-)